MFKKYFYKKLKKLIKIFAIKLQKNEVKLILKLFFKANLLEWPYVDVQRELPCNFLQFRPMVQQFEEWIF